MLPDDDDRPESGPAPPLAIAGTEGLVVSYARCCFPIPFDAIVAYLSSGRGVVTDDDHGYVVVAQDSPPSASGIMVKDHV